MQKSSPRAMEWWKATLFERMLFAGMLLTLAVTGSVQGDPARKAELSEQWQARVEQRYREFETSLERLADAVRPTDPARAALLTKAFGESKKGLVAVQLRELITHIEKGDFKQAIDHQDQVIAEMNSVLQMLLSEGRTDRLQERREQLEVYAKQVKQIADDQKQLRAQTEKMSPESLSKSNDMERAQAKLAENTSSLRGGDQALLSKDSDAKEAAENKPAEADANNPDDAKANEESDTSKSSEEQNASAKGKSKPSQGKGSTNPRGPVPPGGTPPESNEDKSDEAEAMPGEENLAAAEKSMREASEQMKQQGKEKAIKEQDDAIAQLEKTTDDLKKELEELRDEEKKGKLTELESRLRSILDLQQALYDKTVAIDLIPTDKRSRADQQQAIGLSRQEGEVVLNLDQVLGILLEDGTAVAFPETIEQLARDAESVVKRLAKADTGSLTQNIEKDIIESLNEMIQSLQHELGKKREESEPRKGPADGTEETKSPLVAQLAELKMIRSLQHRINERTNALQQSAENGEVPSTETSEAIRDLAERQSRVYEITRDVAQEKSE